MQAMRGDFPVQGPVQVDLPEANGEGAVLHGVRCEFPEGHGKGKCHARRDLDLWAFGADTIIRLVAVWLNGLPDSSNRTENTEIGRSWSRSLD